MENILYPSTGSFNRSILHFCNTVKTSPRIDKQLDQHWGEFPEARQLIKAYLGVTIDDKTRYNPSMFQAFLKHVPEKVPPRTLEKDLMGHFISQD